MRAMTYDCYGDDSVLELTDRPLPVGESRRGC